MKSGPGRAIAMHLEENRSIYVFSIVLLMMGVIFGAVIVNSLNVNQKNDLFTYLTQFFGQVEQGELAAPQTVFSQSFSYYAKYLGLMWFLGLSVIGLPVILVMLFLKGLVVGFTVGFLVSQMGADGFFLAFVTVFPQNVFLVPVFIITAAVSISFSLKICRQIIRKGYEPIFKHFTAYSLFLLFTGAFITLIAVYEAYVSPVLLRSVVQWLA
ncbi:stage II sporulation protein M [Alteribacter lacisalsi]|uniref:Stage II sporulation protein M n=1 Tax=Alteribacter lacisalsi TaxID=2045244 RepID=A0A2W0HES7_9BACI|nr:stage II sporulation protein M [Alteribacter lacisalsi]PYZ98510.1 stage II sporulation protein M [Alteribacter lacisalsi]